MSVFAGIISILDYFKEKLPIQGRIERIRNDLENMTKEKKKLESQPWSEKQYSRYLLVVDRISVLQQQLRNATKD